MPSLPLPAAARHLLLAGSISLLAIALVSGSATTVHAGTRSTATAGAGRIAMVPRPVPVTVNPATTAYLLLDLTTVVCAPQKVCVATLPAAAALLARARAAGATIVYSETPTPGSQILPEVAPRPGEPIVQAHADKFFGTELDQILSSRGIRTLVVVGTAANGAVLYTTFEANLRGFTVVAPVDSISASSRYVMHYSLFQLLNEPGFSNPENTPLKPGAVTLTTTRLVTFGTST
jgi:nicotinamidase-related amidase